MKKKTLLLAGLLASGMFAVLASSPDKNTTEQLRREIRKTYPKAEKLDFSRAGRVYLSDKDGKPLGHVRYTHPLAAGARGFRGPVPVMVMLDASGKVLTVSLLSCREDSSFLRKLYRAEYFDSWSGFSRADAAELDVDGVTGATFSSKAAADSVRSLLREK